MFVLLYLFSGHTS